MSAGHHEVPNLRDVTLTQGTMVIYSSSDMSS